MYNDLYKAWKTEKTTQTPQVLPNDFYQRTAAYLKSLEQDAASSDPHTIQGRLLVREKEMASRLLAELRDTRLRKITSAAKNGEAINVADLTDEERTLVENLSESLSLFKKEAIERPEKALVPAPSTELKVVRFLQDVPEIVGTDLKIYGPYKKEDIGSLPSQNAQALIKQGAAKPIEVRHQADSGYH